MKKNPRLIFFLVPFVSFAIILLSMNGYQYFRMKTSVSTGLIKEISEVKLTAVQTFLKELEEKLFILKDWGENDVLFTGDIGRLNKKIIPLIERQDIISSIIIASSDGQEYFLYKENGNYITRSTIVKKNSSTLSYQQWSEQMKPLKSWKETGGYDPRKRPWFPEADTGDKVHWTPIYTFVQSNEPGVTVSITGRNSEDLKEYMVFGLDVSNKGIEKILTQDRDKQPGVLFLVRGNGKFISGKLRGETQESEDSEQLLPKMISAWQDDGRPEHELLRLRHQEIQWLGSFQKIQDTGGGLWFGLALEERELLENLDKTLYQVNWVELFIAFFGAGLITLVIWKVGLFNKGTGTTFPPDIRFQGYVQQGEGADVEFKSTIRTNLKNGKVGKEIEFAWLKAVVAFLNSTGGTLLLGVTDQAEICGLEADNFESDDRCLLHVKNLLNQHVGAEFSSFFEPTLVSCGEKSVVMLECRPAKDPVFLRVGKNEEFYIRSGPSSIKLSPSQTVSYVQQKR